MLAVFEAARYSTLTPAWPDDPETVGEANAHPDVFANKTVGQVADHFAEIVGDLERKPAIIGTGNIERAIPLTYDQFRFGFMNAVSEEEAKALYAELAVPPPGAPLFQAATAARSSSSLLRRTTRCVIARQRRLQGAEGQQRA